MKYAPRWAQKPDSNQSDVVQALEKIGCSVFSLHRVGDSIPDLLVGYRGLTMLLEVKTERGKLSKEQERWHREWKGHTCVVRSPTDAIEQVMSHVKAHQSR
jgi:hypothetical protein